MPASTKPPRDRHGEGAARSRQKACKQSMKKTAPLSSHTENTTSARNKVYHVDARTMGDIRTVGVPEHAHAMKNRPHTLTLQTAAEIKAKYTWRKLLCRAPAPQKKRPRRGENPIHTTNNGTDGCPQPWRRAATSTKQAEDSRRDCQCTHQLHPPRSLQTSPLRSAAFLNSRQNAQPPNRPPNRADRTVRMQPFRPPLGNGTPIGHGGMAAEC